MVFIEVRESGGEVHDAGSPPAGNIFLQIESLSLRVSNQNKCICMIPH